MFTFELLQRVFTENNVPANALILSDTGTEMSASGITHIFYNDTHNIVMLASDCPSDGYHTSLDNPVIYQFIDNDDFDYDLCDELTWDYLYKFSNGYCCSYCDKRWTCTEADKAECLRKFNDREGYHEVQYVCPDKTYSGWTRWKLLWHENG